VASRFAAVLSSANDAPSPQHPAEAIPARTAHSAFLIILEDMAPGRIGAPLTDNRYCPTTERGIRWRAGWLEARHALMDMTNTCRGRLAPPSLPRFQPAPPAVYVDPPSGLSLSDFECRRCRAASGRR